MRNNSRENPSHTMIANARAVLRGIERLTDYAPANPSFSLAALQLLERSLSEAERRLEDLQHMLDLARNALVLARQAFYSAVQSAKQQVVAQYGDDSMAMEAIGLTRRSERKRTKRERAESSPEA
jgi:CRP-like cAMP-binding protein